jgi:putative membrane protein
MSTRHARPAAKSASHTVQDRKNATPGVARDSFVRLAANAVVYELEAADLALERSRHRKIRGFARELLADFEKMGHELRSCLDDGGTPHPPAENLDASFQTLLNDLYDASEADFDKRYLAQVQSTHSAAINLFQSYRRAGGDGGLASLCGHGLPLLEHHLEMADQPSGLL